MNISQMTKPQKKPRRSRGWVAALAVLVLLAAAAGGVWLWFSRDVRPPEGTSLGTIAAAKTDGEAGSEPVSEDRNQKKDVFTFLIAGADMGELRTDVMMLVCFDTAAKKVNVLSIPRDTMIDGPQTGANKKINAAYGRKAGIEATLEEVRKITGIGVNRYAVTSFDGFARIIDAVGGIDYDVPMDMRHADGEYTINLKKGPQTLSGSEALQFVRFREKYRADLGRIDRTQGFMAAVAKQLLAERNVLNLAEIAGVLLEETETDLSMGELTWLASKTVGFDPENITFMTLPGKSRTVSGISFYIPDPDETLAAVNEKFNPYKDALTAEDLQIVRVR